MNSMYYEFGKEDLIDSSRSVWVWWLGSTCFLNMWRAIVLGIVSLKPLYSILFVDGHCFPFGTSLGHYTIGAMHWYARFFWINIVVIWDEGHESSKKKTRHTKIKLCKLLEEIILIKKEEHKWFWQEVYYFW